MITLERFKDLVAAYGADPAHWPERERLPALDLLQRSAEARSVMDEARALDRLLDLSPTTAVSPELQARILAALPSGGASGGAGIRGLLVSLLPGRPAWVPAAAFALSLALGIGAGAYAPTLAGLDTGGRDAALVAMSGGFDDDFWTQPGEGI